MAYADTIRAAQATFTTTANLIDGLLATTATASAGSSTSTTGTTLAQVPDMSLTVTVPANSIVKVSFSFIGSNSTTTINCQYGLSEDSTATATTDTAREFRGPVASVNAFEYLGFVEHTYTPTAGSHTYRALWLADSGAAFYMRYRRITYMIFQKGA